MLYELITSPAWDTVTMWACAVGLVACAFFVTAYQRRVGWSWTRTPYGRYLMSRKVILAALFCLILANRLLPGWPGRQMVTALLICAFAAQTFIPYRLLVKAQEDAEKRQKDRV
jgi:hypothetical protein